MRGYSKKVALFFGPTVQKRTHGPKKECRGSFFGPWVSPHRGRRPTNPSLLRFQAMDAANTERLIFDSPKILRPDGGFYEARS